MRSTLQITVMILGLVLGSAAYSINQGPVLFSAKTCATHQLMKALSATGLFTCVQPAAADLSDGTTGTGSVVLNGGPTLSGTLTVTGATTLTGGIVGVGTTSPAAAGNVGELILAQRLSASEISITTATAKTMISLSLTAGDWDLFGQVCFDLTSITGTALVAAYSLVDNSISTSGGSGIVVGTNDIILNLLALSGSGTYCVVPPSYATSVASTTTMYLVGQATFSGGTAKEFGSLTARRIR